VQILTELRSLRIPLLPFSIRGMVQLPERCRGLVVLVESRGSKPSSRERRVIDELTAARIGNARFDLTTPDEGAVAAGSERRWTSLHFLAGRLVVATDWLTREPQTRELPLGYWGAGGHAAVALLAASARSPVVKAVASCNGRPELVEPALATVVTPTLLMVDRGDRTVMDASHRAMPLLAGEKDLRVISDEPRQPDGSDALIATLTRDWFVRYLPPAGDQNDPA
jgi:putative phosphoribosyl transferase